VAGLSFAEHAARRFEPAVRAWPSPLAMAQDLDPTVLRTPALDLIDRSLVDVADGATDRLQVFLSPQEGKSSLVSRRFPAWLLSHDPTLRIGIVSYGAELAENFGRTVKRDVEQHPELGIHLRRDSRAAGRWDTEEGGGLYCVGLAGGLTGRPLDYLLYDDVIKDRAQAESAAHRNHAWDHWEQVGRTRLSARGKVIVTLTRWHADDLPGRLAERERGLWRVLAIPAVSEGDGDPLGRPAGVEMVSARRRAAGYFLDLQERMAAYTFNAIYQQRPTAPKGSLFPRGGWRFWNWSRWPNLLDLDGRTVDLRDCWRFLTVDLAASRRTSADFTVAAAWALTMDRQLVCLGRVRDRTDEGGHWALISPLAVEWRAPDVGVESTMMGTTLVRQAVRAGLAPFDLHADTDKITRAIPAGHMVTQGQVWLPTAADWLDEWISELADFPSGAHDDQADVMAYAAKLVHGWQPQQSPGMPNRPAADPWDAQVSDALGLNGHDPLAGI
jgi:predicted phage terminase large subunit-like protein